MSHKDAKVSFWLAAEDKKKAEDMARIRGVDLSTFVRSALAQAVEQVDHTSEFVNKLNWHEKLLQDLNAQDELLVSVLELMVWEILQVSVVTVGSKASLTQERMDNLFEEFLGDAVERFKGGSRLVTRLSKALGKSPRNRAI